MRGLTGLQRRVERIVETLERHVPPQEVTFETFWAGEEPEGEDVFYTEWGPAIIEDEEE